MIVRLALGIDDESKARFIMIGETMHVAVLTLNDDYKTKIQNSAKALAHLIHKYASYHFQDALLDELQKLYDYEENKRMDDYKILLEEGEKLLKEFQVQQKEEEEDE